MFQRLNYFIVGLSDRNETSPDENRTPSTKQPRGSSYGPKKHSRRRPISSTGTSSFATKPSHSPPSHLSSHDAELQDEDSDNQSQNENLSNNVTEGLSAVADDNFIAVEANDDVDLDQTEDEVAGIGTLGRVWSLNEVTCFQISNQREKRITELNLKLFSEPVE